MMDELVHNPHSFRRFARDLYEWSVTSRTKCLLRPGFPFMHFFRNAGGNDQSSFLMLVIEREVPIRMQCAVREENPLISRYKRQSEQNRDGGECNNSCTDPRIACFKKYAILLETIKIRFPFFIFRAFLTRTLSNFWCMFSIIPPHFILPARFVHE